jgi:hypothetical protein
VKNGLTMVLAAAITLSACANIGQMSGEGASQRYTDYAGEPIDRFTAFSVDGWTPISRNKLVIWTGIRWGASAVRSAKYGALMLGR